MTSRTKPIQAKAFDETLALARARTPAGAILFWFGLALGVASYFDLRGAPAAAAREQTLDATLWRRDRSAVTKPASEATTSVIPHRSGEPCQYCGLRVQLGSR